MSEVDPAGTCPGGTAENVIRYDFPRGSARGTCPSCLAYHLAVDPDTGGVEPHRGIFMFDSPVEKAQAHGLD